MPSRISGACTPCRSKKQKCSGHHPTCTQCDNASIDCTWPEQRKRGPAKGYIEALESRLHSAESLLLAILPLINDNVLERASQGLRQDYDDETDGVKGRRSSPPALNKKTGLDYWDQFPIDSRRNIRRWQVDCEAQSNNNTQYANQDRSSSGRRYRSRTRSPGSAGVASPRGSASSMSQQHNNWMQTMQPYVTHQNQMQAGAAQQLMNLSSQGQRRDHWITQQQTPDSMQLDPHLMQQPHQHPQQQQPHPRPMPAQSSQIYTGDIQPNLFW